ncbi:uncharacterized protein LOC131180160 [Hevea brasiliensis]|uniref:uncharacterized protein LOC131180160 n=1 Tax=Hevea brasiliensis TaxID=3981 RepID=UPI002600AED7|nr:uncharacterized protein LOC131180160 [Hevea brasiliensis]
MILEGDMIEVMDNGSELGIEYLQPFYEEIFELVMKEGYLDPKVVKSGEMRLGCPYHGGAPDHALVDCEEFKDEVDKLMSITLPEPNSIPQYEKPTLSPPVLKEKIEYITRSGRCYGPEEIERKNGKAKVGELPENVEEGATEVEKGEANDEIDPIGLTHTKALHVIVKCRGCIIAKVLIDNGSALNVLPSATLAKLLVEPSLIRKSSMTVQAFDDTKRDVLGDIDLLLQIKACTFDVTFQVMNIEPAYTILLGRLWIHAANAVPSTLH